MSATTRTTKLISVLLFLCLASSLIFVKGCGRIINGRASGGCSSNSAPAGSVIIAPTNLGAPFIDGDSCYPALGFTVTDSEGIPLNDICVEIFSSADIALHSGLPNCGAVSANPQSSIVTKTDRHGVVSVELLTGPTPTGAVHFVEVVSGGASAVAETAPAQ